MSSRRTDKVGLLEGVKMCKEPRLSVVSSAVSASTDGVAARCPAFAFHDAKSALDISTMVAAAILNRLRSASGRPVPTTSTSGNPSCLEAGSTFYVSPRPSSRG